MQSMATFPIGMSIDDSTVAAMEEAKMHESAQGYEKTMNQSAITVSNIKP